MPHQCIKCNTLYKDGASEIMKGCSCGGKLFFFIKKEKLDELVLKKFQLSAIDNTPDLAKWRSFLDRLFNPKNEVNIALVGKYVELQDAYKSILESFIHAGAENECKVNVHSIHSEHITASTVDGFLKDMDGILVAPGFGERGIEGKIVAIEYARINKIPFLGICLGMQMAVIEYSRNVLKLEDAMTTEIKANAKNPVIDLMEHQKSLTAKGGTMRLGKYQCRIEEGSLAHRIYKTLDISERHRHRYEMNNTYVDMLAQAGLIPSGKNNDTGLVEIVELPEHPFFIGVQFHPELKSTPENPHPLFVSLVEAALKRKLR